MSEIKFFQQVINILRGTADILLRILCYLVFILSASWARQHGRRQAAGRSALCWRQEYWAEEEQEPYLLFYWRNFRDMRVCLGQAITS